MGTTGWSSADLNQKAGKPAGTAQVQRSTPKPTTDTPGPAALNTAPVLKLKAEVSGYTFANKMKRVVTLCPEQHAEALQSYIEAFQP